MLEPKQQFSQDGIVNDKVLFVTSATTLTVRDQVVRASASAAFIVTLPSVVEAVGKIFTILARVATAGNTVTVSDADDSEDWTDIVLNANNEGVVLYSDGIKWWPLLVDNT